MKNTIIYLTLFSLFCYHGFSQPLSKEQEKSLKTELKNYHKQPEKYQAFLDEVEILKETIVNQEEQIKFLQREIQDKQKTINQQAQMLEFNLDSLRYSLIEQRNAGIVYQVQIPYDNSVSSWRNYSELTLAADIQSDGEPPFVLAYFKSENQAWDFVKQLELLQVKVLRDGQDFSKQKQDDFTDYIDENETVRAEIKARLDREHLYKGTPNNYQRQIRTGIVQRTGKARGTDHEILIDDILSGRIAPEFTVTASLQTILIGAEFHDIGASVDKPIDGLGDPDAPMTHDFYYNVAEKHGLKVVAHDLNEKEWISNGQSMDYIDRYNSKVEQGLKEPYPFEVNAVPPVITSITDLGINSEQNKPLILRAVNAIDLYYTPEQRDEHFRGLCESGVNHAILYIFNNQVLYKPQWRSTFLKLGEMDINFTHRGNGGTGYWEKNKDSRNSENAYFLVK